MNLKLVLKQFAALIATVAGLYAVVLAVTLVLVPRQMAQGGLDTGRAGASLYLTEPKYVFLARSALDTPRDKLIMVGASNVVVGFKQPQVQALIPGAEVHNLGVGGSNMTQVRQIVDLVQEVQSAEARRHNTFVIGMWYGLFADDAVRWNTPDRHAGDTDIDIERYRYAFYHRGEHGAVPTLPARYLDEGAALIHPYLVLDLTARRLTAGLREALGRKKPSITDEQRNAVVLSEREKQQYLDFWQTYMGKAGPASGQFAVLRELIAEVTAQGGRVVLVDLPLPSWHAQRSPNQAKYAAQREQLLGAVRGNPQVAAVTLQDANADDYFSDEVHPKPRIAERWAQQLASAFNPGGSAPVLAQGVAPGNPRSPINVSQ